LKPYTVELAPVVKGPLPGTDEFIRQVVKRSNRALWNNGSFINREKHGHPGSISNHARGLAIDFSYRYNSSAGAGRKASLKFFDSMIANADALGVELVIDYFVEPFGRSWRCDRAAWRQATKPTFVGAPGGDWFHVEIALDKALSANAVSLAFKGVYGDVAKPI
jgi:hypothetical protein